jgi:hypothetical protein
MVPEAIADACHNGPCVVGVGLASWENYLANVPIEVVADVKRGSSTVHRKTIRAVKQRFVSGSVHKASGRSGSVQYLRVRKVRVNWRSECMRGRPIK